MIAGMANIIGSSSGLSINSVENTASTCTLRLAFCTGRVGRKPTNSIIAIIIRSIEDARAAIIACGKERLINPIRRPAKISEPSGRSP